MLEAVERLLDAFATGRMSRRQVATRVVGLALGSAGAATLAHSAAPERPTFRTSGLNHLGLRVSDVPRSRDFYRSHLGMSVLRDNAPGNCFLRAGEHYLGLFRSGSPAVDHICFTVEDYQADEAMSKIDHAGFTPRREENRVYFDDLDGIEIQLDSRFGSWPGPVPGDLE